MHRSWRALDGQKQAAHTETGWRWGSFNSEIEGIAGMVNLIAVLETGKDLRGKEWPEINAAAKGLDRIILIPIANVDGRARVPLRMESFQGKNETLHEYMNTGAGLDGKNIGWPQCKEFIPLDFSKTQFPGGDYFDRGECRQHNSRVKV